MDSACNDTHLDILVEAMYEQGRQHAQVTMLQCVALWRERERSKLRIAADTVTAEQPKQVVLAPGSVHHHHYRNEPEWQRSGGYSHRGTQQLSSSLLAHTVEPDPDVVCLQRRVMSTGNLSTIRGAAASGGGGARAVPPIAGFGLALNTNTSPTKRGAGSARERRGSLKGSTSRRSTPRTPSDNGLSSSRGTPRRETPRAQTQRHRSSSGKRAKEVVTPAYRLHSSMQRTPQQHAAFTPINIEKHKSTTYHRPAAVDAEPAYGMKRRSSLTFVGPARYQPFKHHRHPAAAHTAA